MAEEIQTPASTFLSECLALSRDLVLGHQAPTAKELRPLVLRLLEAEREEDIESAKDICAELGQLVAALWTSYNEPKIEQPEEE